MSVQVSWEQGNNDYLSAALTWLRLLLERQAQPQSQVILPPVVLSTRVVEVEPPKKGGWFRKNPEPEMVVEPDAPPNPSPPTLVASASPEEVEQAFARMEELERQLVPPPALAVLAQQLGLSRFERDVLLLCVALDLDTRIAGLCARAQADNNRPYPTFALAMALFDEAGWDVTAPHSPLRCWRLIEINQPPAQPLTASAIRADERIVSYVKGLNYLDDRLAALVSLAQSEAPHISLLPSQQAVVDEIVRHWQQSEGPAELPVTQLVGADSHSKQIIAARATALLGRTLYRLSAETLPTHAGELDTLARLWQRESILLPIALYLDAQEFETGGSETQSPAFNRFLSRSDGVFFLGTREFYARLDSASLALDVTRPDSSEQKTVWEQALGEAAADNPGKLSGEFSLNASIIRQIAKGVLIETAGQPQALALRLWDECRLYSRSHLDNLAQRIDLKMTWDDLVLPEEETDLLHQLANQVGQRSKVYEEWGFARRMNRGLGISALFAGDSGTGKTMAAEVIANDLRLSLYRVDLSAVVSKYIGETEKNLRRVFDAAEVGGIILFFDEADAIFGKRSEVKDAHDRYANIEINYLLQRMEAFRGLAILATNMKNALDTAFMRRLRFVVTFPFPGQAERKRIWQKAFPPDVPLEKLDYDRLARFNLTGGSIYNLAINAAFRAAHEGKAVTMPLILATVRAEFRKLERPINEADFRWQPK